MITFLRNHAQSWFIKILLSIIVVTFVISFGIGTFSNPKEVLVKIGRHEVLVQEYLEAYQRELDRLRERFPGNAEELAKQIGLRRQVYESLVNRRLIMLSAPDRGLVVTDAEVREAVRSQPGFQADGRFNAQAYEAVLRQNRMTPLIYETRMREDLLLQKFQRNLFAGVIVGESEVERRFRINNEKLTVDYVYVDPARFARTAAVSDEELKAYYAAHQDEFRQPAQYKLRFFVLGTKTLLPQVEVQERAVERFYERNLDTRFTKLGRVHARHILKKFPADGTPEQEQSIMRELAGLRAQALSGADFGALAKKHSEDASAAKGGDLGFFAHDEMLPAFADAAFAMEPGEISEAVRSQFGFHLIQVLAREPKVVQPLKTVRAEIEADLKNERAERKLDLEAERMPQRMEKDGVEAAAKEFGVAVQSSDWIDGTGELPGIGSAGPLYGKLRNAAVGHAGVMRRNPVQGHVFYQVAEVQAAFVKPLEAVRQQATAQVRAQKGAQAAAETGQAALPTLKTADDFKALAAKYTLFLKQAEFSAADATLGELGANRDFQRTAFGLTQEQPFGISLAGGKVYLLHLRKRALPTGAEAENLRRAAAQAVEQELQQYYMNSELNRLKADYHVELLVPELVTSA